MGQMSCCSGRWRAERQQGYHVLLHQWTALHCVKAGGADPDCLRSIFDYGMGIYPYLDIGSKIRYPDFQISINNPTTGQSILQFPAQLTSSALEKNLFHIC